MKKYLLSIILCLLFGEHMAAQDVVAQVGVYEFATAVEQENHYIHIDQVNDKFVVYYIGSESNGEHGVFFYKTKVSNFIFNEDEFSFEIRQRDLYLNSQSIFIDRDRSRREEPVGVSKDILKYSGTLSKAGIELTCESEYNSCWQSKLFFKQI